MRKNPLRNNLNLTIAIPKRNASAISSEFTLIIALPFFFYWDSGQIFACIDLGVDLRVDTLKTGGIWQQCTQHMGNALQLRRIVGSVVAGVVDAEKWYTAKAGH